MSDNNGTWTTQEVLPSKLEAGTELIARIVDRLGKFRWSQHDIFSIRLALEEALVNAIKHGNRLDLNKKVRVDLQISSKSFRVSIADDGPGFRIESIPDPTAPENIERASGRGLMLMRNFMTRVRYNRQGNRVTMEKLPDHAAEPSDREC